MKKDIWKRWFWGNCDGYFRILLNKWWIEKWIVRFSPAPVSQSHVLQNLIHDEQSRCLLPQTLKGARTRYTVTHLKLTGVQAWKLKTDKDKWEFLSCSCAAAVKSHLALTFKASQRCFHGLQCLRLQENTAQRWTRSSGSHQHQSSLLSYFINLQI